MVINFSNDCWKEILFELKSKGYQNFKNIFDEKFNNTKNYAIFLHKNKIQLKSLNGNNANENIISPQNISQSQNSPKLLLKKKE